MLWNWQYFYRLTINFPVYFHQYFQPSNRLPPFIINGENTENDPHSQRIPENNGPIKMDLPPNPPKKNMNSRLCDSNKNVGDNGGENGKETVSGKDRGRGSDKGSDKGSELHRNSGRVIEKCIMGSKEKKIDRSLKRSSSSEHKDGVGEEGGEGERAREGGDDNDDDGESESFIVTTDASGNNLQMALIPKKGSAQGKIILWIILFNNFLLYLSSIFLLYFMYFF
jgi:hypothetical protein